LQSALLDRAATLLHPGGILVYCTCSLEPEEGEQQIARFLKDHPGFARVPIDADEIGGLTEAITRDGDLRTLPFHWAEHGGMDGFFAARVQRA
jgi:16S rRNA (cytosine967-C5)-methyltransferase